MTREEFNALAATWPSCDYWDCDKGQERLGHATIEEALDEFFESCRNEDELREWAADGWIVYGWTRKVVSKQDVRHMVESLTERFHEIWVEDLELGDPEDEDTEEIAGLHECLDAYMGKRHVWSCEQTHKVELDLASVVEIARVLEPELFEAKARTA